MINKAIGSKTDIYSKSCKRAGVYMNCVGDLLEDENVKRLDDFSQHIGTTRLQHSLNVSYYSFLISRKLGWDYRSAARAGILHDLYLYDRHIDRTGESHIFRHPKEALKNAQSVTDLNPIERDAIANHMWPISKHFLHHKEAYVVSAADKYCAVLEFSEHCYKSINYNIRRLFS